MRWSETRDLLIAGFDPVLETRATPAPDDGRRGAARPGDGFTTDRRFCGACADRLRFRPISRVRGGGGTHGIPPRHARDSAAARPGHVPAAGPTRGPSPTRGP